MDPTQLIQNFHQLAETGAAVGAAIPFTSLVKRMLGPAADEVAERVRDEIKIYRFGRQLSLLQKAEQMAKMAGFAPQAVPIKMLFPLLEGASLEENEDLHDMWAALLANAADPVNGSRVRPSFTETLKLMTPEGARFLDAAFARANERPISALPTSHLGVTYFEKDKTEAVSSALRLRELTLVDLGTFGGLFTLFAQVGCTILPPDALVTSASAREELEKDEIDRQAFAVVMDELTRFQMWSVTSTRDSGDHFYLSSYAVQFVSACHAPEELPQTP